MRTLLDVAREAQQVLLNVGEGFCLATQAVQLALESLDLGIKGLHGRVLCGEAGGEFLALLLQFQQAGLQLDILIKHPFGLSTEVKGAVLVPELVELIL
jgi:hypothetical protein